MAQQDDNKIIRASKYGQTYNRPELYDIAFDFRDVPAQVDFLLSVAGRYLGRPVASAMELSCGPAYHTREMARRGLVSDGLDLEANMVAYAQKLIDGEKLDATIFEGDMRSFQAGRKYDLVYILMASFAQLHTNRDIIDNLACAADMLNDRGIYIISTAHPRDFYGEEEASADTNWEMTRGDITITTSWGGKEQRFDPLTEIDDIIVSFDVTSPEGTVRYEFPERYRRCSRQTFAALLELSGRFDQVDQYGDLDTNITLSNDRACWRFIPILQKKKQR